MTAYVGRVLTALSAALEFNSATLSGAIDVIVIEDERGRRHSSPFHVRFGKLQLLKAGGCPVTVELNGRSTTLRLLLGPDGCAYFYNPPTPADAPNAGANSDADLDAAVASPRPRSSAAPSQAAGAGGRVPFRPTLLQASAGSSGGGGGSLATDIVGLTRANSQPQKQSRPAGSARSTGDLARMASAPIAVPGAKAASMVDGMGASGGLDGVVGVVAHIEDAAAGYVSDSEVEVSRNERDGTAEVVDEPRSPPVSAVERRILKTYARSRSIRKQKKANTAAGTPTSTPVKVLARPEEGSLAGRGLEIAPLPPAVLPFQLEDTEEVAVDVERKKGCENLVPEMPDDGSSDPYPEAVGEKRAPRGDVIESADGKHDGEAKQQRERVMEASSGADAPPRMIPTDVVSPQVKGGVERSAAENGMMENKVLPPSSPNLPPDLTAPPTLALASVSLSREAENATIVAEESKLEVRSWDGMDMDDDINDGGTACLGASPLPRKLSSTVTAADSQPDPVDLSRAITSALDRVSGGELAVARHSMMKGAAVEESDYEQNSMLVMSMCGKLLEPDMSEEQVGDLVEKHRVSYSEFAANPNVLFNSDMLFCIDDRLVEFRIAAPFVMSSLAFGTPLDVDLLSSQMQALPRYGSKRSSGNEEGNEGADGGEVTSSSSPKDSRNTSPKEAIKSGGRFGWFGWSHSANTPSPPIGEPLLSEEDLLALEGSINEAAEQSAEQSEEQTPLPEQGTEPREVTGGGVSSQSIDVGGKEPGEGDGVGAAADSSGALTNAPAPQAVARSLPPARSSAELMDGEDDVVLKESSITAAELLAAAEREQLQKLQDEQMAPMFDPNDSCFSLTPTSEQLAALDLKPGPNTIRFTVESSAAEVDCRIFLWGPDIKIVISDVDGTITRSDVLGHVLPAVGRDWSHVGVAGLYTEIARHGYKFMYLTARPIGMASTTRDFLHSVTQGGARLPNGPVLMSPNRLVESFTREVIRRKPQEFKIAALREVRSLFPIDYNPFHAGFGNRDTDVISYRAVGLLPHRIIVVNTAAELLVNSVRYESAASYSTLRELVASMFPDIGRAVGRDSVHNVTDGAMFNSWNYWRPSLPDVDLDALLAEQDADSK